MPHRVLAIVNPISRAGRARKLWPALEARLRDTLGPLDVEWTRAPGDATRLAREGVRAGVELVVVAGGDGTASEVAHGLLGAGLGGYAEVALLPLGSGGDLARGLGIAQDPGAAIDALASGETRPLDAGRVHYRDTEGETQQTHFLNITSIGISGLVTALANKSQKAIGGRLAFASATLRALLRWQAAEVELVVDDAVVHTGPLDLATIANGPCFGGGMQVAPDARHGDGLFDLVVVAAASKSRFVRKLPLVYRGAHLDLDEVSSTRGTIIEARSDASVPIEVDGEPVGTLPIRVEMLPAALTLRGSAA